MGKVYTMKQHVVTYPIHEMFHTFQGEGVWLGHAAFFIRTYGCDQRCHFCDSAGTWHKDYMPDHIEKLTARQIMDKIISYGITPATKIVLTGGEPSLHNLFPLIEVLHNNGFSIHIETAGHKFLPGALDWITLSPKTFSIPPMRENILRADEIKIIVETEEGLARDIAVSEGAKAVMWLHPEWSKRNDKAVMELIMDTVKSNPRFRAGYQVHKLYKADLFDLNARRDVVPLGGEVENGNSQ